MTTLCVKNWKKFQHYKHRDPPWIKLHKTLLTDQIFASLADSSQILAIWIWLLAAEHENGAIPHALSALSWRLHKPRSRILRSLNPLIKAGFFSWDASTPLADCQQDDSVSRVRVETEESRGPNSPPKGGPKEVIFQEYLPWLNERAGKNCRSVVGKWLAETKDDAAMLSLLGRAREAAPVDPVAWIAARLKPFPENDPWAGVDI